MCIPCRGHGRERVVTRQVQAPRCPHSHSRRICFARRNSIIPPSTHHAFHRRCSAAHTHRCFTARRETAAVVPPTNLQGARSLGSTPRGRSMSAADRTPRRSTRKKKRIQLQSTPQRIPWDGIAGAPVINGRFKAAPCERGDHTFCCPCVRLFPQGDESIAMYEYMMQYHSQRCGYHDWSS